MKNGTKAGGDEKRFGGNGREGGTCWEGSLENSDLRALKGKTTDRLTRYEEKTPIYAVFLHQGSWGWHHRERETFKGKSLWGWG